MTKASRQQAVWQFSKILIMDKETEIVQSIKVRVAEVLINLNLIEAKISDIITTYINSEREDFIRKVLLSSLIVNFSSKLNVLKYILRSEKVEPPKDFFKAVAIIMTKRNVLAHSDSLLNIEADVVDVDFDWNHDGTYMYPIYGPEEPNLPIINDGVINFENISKIIDDFTKYFEIAEKALDSIENSLYPKKKKKLKYHIKINITKLIIQGQYIKESTAKTHHDRNPKSLYLI